MTKELSDYVTNNMSTEKTRDFLEMQGELMTSFKPTLLKTVVYEKKDTNEAALELALKDLAKQATNMGCKYVTNIQTANYHPLTPTPSEGAFLFFGPKGAYPASIGLTATGLIPKKS